MTTPTEPTTLRTALERDEVQEAAYRAVLYVSGEARPRSGIALIEALEQDGYTIVPRATSATPAPAADEARCFEGVAALHAGIPTVVTCGEPRDSETHEPGAPDYDHPFQPAPTPAQTTPPATEEAWDEADLMCPNCQTPWKCNGPHLNDQTAYALANLNRTEPEPAEPHPSVDVRHTPPATEPVAALVEAVRSGLEMYDWTARTHHSFDHGDYVPFKDCPYHPCPENRAALTLLWPMDDDVIVAAARAEGLDGAWAEVERVLPEGWWLHSIYQRYFGDEVGYTATAHGVAGLGLQGNGSTPVEALRSLATNLRETADDR